MVKHNSAVWYYVWLMSYEWHRSHIRRIINQNEIHKHRLKSWIGPDMDNFIHPRRACNLEASNGILSLSSTRFSDINLHGLMQFEKKKTNTDASLKWNKVTQLQFIKTQFFQKWMERYKILTGEKTLDAFFGCCCWFVCLVLMSEHLIIVIKVQRIIEVIWLL